MIRPYIFVSIIHLIYCVKINIFEPTIGKWKLLYTTNDNIMNNNFDLNIVPINNKINELLINIKRYETYGFISFVKVINCKVINDNNVYTFLKNNNLCSLFVFTTKKIVKSIGIFEFPYFAINYISGMNPKYIVKWKVNNDLGRLYVIIDKDTYVFEKKYYDKLDERDESVTTNIFLITNTLSFLLGKFLENFIHIN